MSFQLSWSDSLKTVYLTFVFFSLFLGLYIQLGRTMQCQKDPLFGIVLSERDSW